MDALTVAKEITVVLVGRMGLAATPEDTGEKAGKIFEAILKRVVHGMNEANKVK